MYSHWSDHSRQYSERRHRDPDDEDWKKHETQRNSYRKYGGSMERTSTSSEYSDSPSRQSSKDSVNRERGWKSPLRKHLSSPDWGASEKKRRRLTEDEDHYKYRHLNEVKTGRQLSLDSAYVHPSPDFKHKDDFESRQRTRSSGHGHHHEEFVHRKRDEDDHERTWGCPRARTPQTHDDSIKKRDISHQKARPDENKSSKGFQRFLDVLNKGVNVATLTKIMTSVREDDRPQSLTSHLNIKDQPSSPRSAGREQEYGQNPRSEDVEFWKVASSDSPHKSLSTPKESSLSDELPLQSCNGDQSYSSCSGSLTHLDKTTLTPEEEHKHKQAQHVLQAIGMNIEFEELGQMSHRIQERLYGRKDSDRGRLSKPSREGDTIRQLSPKLHNRSSSSSRSTCSPSPQKSRNKDSHSFQQAETEKQHHIQVHHSIDYGQKSSSETLQESTDSEVKSRENAFPCGSYSQTLTYTLPEGPPVPMMPMYSPAGGPSLAFPALVPNLSQPRPQLCFPPVPPYPQPPPVNSFPAVLAQMQPLFPPPPFTNPLVPPLNPPQKSKPLSRPRCLQVIETKQPS